MLAPETLLAVVRRLKRGPIVVALAIAGIAIAWGMQFLVFDPRIAWSGVLAVGVGAYLAYQNLR